MHALSVLVINQAIPILKQRRQILTRKIFMDHHHCSQQPQIKENIKLYQ